MRQPLSRTSAVLGTTALIALLVLVPVRAQGTKDIVEVAIAAGSFKTLVAAVQAAGLVDVLKRPGPLTVLAPTDEAFAKIPKSDLDALMKDKVKLAAVLQYHVLTGNVSADDLKMMKNFGTVQGPAHPDLNHRHGAQNQQRHRHQGRHLRQQRRGPRHRYRAAAEVKFAV